jgi:peptide/nickel transport system substrate-binding protein
MASYWDRFTRRRVTRRRALAGSSALVASAAFLAACGGDDDEGGATTGATGGSTGTTGTTGATGATGATGGATGSTGATGSSGLISAPEKSTDRAVAGGTLRDFQNADMLHFDVLGASNNPVINFSAVFAYPRLLKFQSAEYPDVPDGSSVGEVATEWEMGGDRLSLTFKLRQGMKWDARSPTNGRPIDAEDVVFSWNKYIQLNASAQDLAYDAENSPGAPIESVSAPDAQTVVLHLKQFDASMLQLLTAWDHFYVMPRESDGQFDPETEIRGHGPWILEEYVPSASVTWAKNPDYYVEGRPFPDKVSRPIVVDYSQQLAQFRAGNIWTSVTTATPEDVVQTKADAPGSIIQQESNFGTTVSPFITFGYEGDSPFKDARMRQALSMLLDREAYADVVENRDGFAADGLDLEIARNTIVAPGQGEFWLDPMDEATFGENHKYLKYNPEEAAKLMEAAGHGGGVTFNVYYNTENTYGAAYHRMLDIYEGMLAAGGMTLQREGSPYAFYRERIYDYYLAPVYETRGDLELSGIVHKALRGFPTVAAGLFGMMHNNGGFYQGATKTGNNVRDGDPDLNALIEKLKVEPEREAQYSMTHDIIRYVTGQMYNVPRPTIAKRFSNVWPAIGNVGVDSTYAGGNIWVEERLNWWVDSSAPGAS